MAKRYIETSIWQKAWFRKLDVETKALWLYLITKCDHAGIIDFDPDSFNFHLKIDQCHVLYLELFKSFEDRIVLYENNTKIWVKTFINYQYGGIDTLNPNVRPQKAVIDRLINQGLLDPETMSFTQVETKPLSDESKPIKTLEAYKPELEKKFGKSGAVNVKKANIPPVIYKNQIIISNLQKSEILSIDYNSGKLIFKPYNLIKTEQLTSTKLIHRCDI